MADKTEKKPGFVEMCIRDMNVAGKQLVLHHLLLAVLVDLRNHLYGNLEDVYKRQPPTLAGTFSASCSPAAKSARLFSIPGRAPHAPMI